MFLVGSFFCTAEVKVAFGQKLVLAPICPISDCSHATGSGAICKFSSEFLNIGEGITVL